MAENTKLSQSVQVIDTVTDGATGDTGQRRWTNNTIQEPTNKTHPILSEVLGGLPLKIGISIVLFYHLLYIAYKAFAETRTDDTVQQDCFCNPRDQTAYRWFTFTLMGAWILFLPAFALYKTTTHFACVNRICCKREHEDYEEIKKLFDKYNSQIELRKQFFHKEVHDMVTTYYLDNEHYDSKSKKLKMAEANRKNSVQKDDKNEPDVSKLSNMNWKEWCSCTKHCGFMFFKVIFISVRFAFRLAIIPLFQLHWLDDYAWNCIFNDFLRQYCATIRNEYFIGLDHSLVVYVMYILVLLAILFSIIINWFPRGIPKIILNFEGNFNSLTINVDGG